MSASDDQISGGRVVDAIRKHRVRILVLLAVLGAGYRLYALEGRVDELDRRRCEDHPRCEEAGECALGEGPRGCAPSRTEHCAQSTYCKQAGFCSYEEGECVKR